MKTNSDLKQIIKVKLKKDLPGFEAGREFDITNPNNSYLEALDKNNTNITLYWNDPSFFEFIYSEPKPVFKVGDIVCTIPGLSNLDTNSNYSGHGYKENYTFKIDSVHGNYFYPEKHGEYVIYDNKENGMFSNAIRHCTQEEIELYKNANGLKIGDTVILFKHRLNSSYSSKIGSIATIRRFTHNNTAFEMKNRGGIWFSEDVRIATPEEIEISKREQLKIAKYTPEFISDDLGIRMVKYGCQQFSIDELRAYKKLVQHPIDAQIKIEGTDITLELLDTLINKF